MANYSKINLNFTWKPAESIFNTRGIQKFIFTFHVHSVALVGEKLEMLMERGSIVHEEKPFVWVLSAKYRFTRCDYCFARYNVFKCTKCKYVRYCSSECQRRGRPDHKTECTYLKQLRNGQEPSNTIRLLARVVVKLKRGGGSQQGWYSKNKFRVFRDLMSHYQDIKEDVIRYEEFNKIYDEIFNFLHGELVPNPVELLGMYGRMIINCFTMYDDELVGVGTAVYLGASTLDHSCRPNAVAVFSGTTIHVRLIHDIPDYDWSKVRIAYIELIKPTQERQQELQAAYYFLCDCSRCTDPTMEDLASSILCSNFLCQQPVSTVYLGKKHKELKCKNCDTVIEQDICDQYLKTTELTMQEYYAMKTTDIAYFDVCQICLNRQQGIFHPLNVLHVKTLDLAYESGTRLGKTDFCESIAPSLAHGLRVYLGDYHPQLGLHYYSWAKILLEKNKAQEALNIIKKGEQILVTAYGSGHPFCRRDVHSLILEANDCVEKLNRNSCGVS